MPGSRALAFASRWFEPALVASVFEPLVADWQREWHASSRSRRPWVRVRGLTAFVVAAIVSSPSILTVPSAHDVMARAIGRVLAFTAVMSVVLAVPFFNSTGPQPERMARVLFAVIPSGAILALPFSMLLAIDVIRRAHNVAPHVARAMALRMAVAGVIFMVIGHGFVVPAANQQFRILSTPAGVPPPMPGIREQSTLQLIGAFTGEDSTARYTRGGAIRSELTNRAVLALMPAVFVWLRWIAHDVRRPRRFWPMPVAAMIIVCIIGFFASYWSGFIAESAWHLKPGDGLWLPIVIAALIGVGRRWVTSRRDAALRT